MSVFRERRKINAKPSFSFSSFSVFSICLKSNLTKKLRCPDTETTYSHEHTHTKSPQTLPLFLSRFLDS